MQTKRIMVDMSATLIHHGHIRLLKKASEYGKVIVALTTDDEIVSKKGYEPEIEFQYRKEVLESIKYVDEVVGVPWLIDEAILDKFDIDLLVHGDDNSNIISKDRLLILPRTKGISSTQIRKNAIKSITQINNHKLMLTPGPSVVLYENLTHLKPVFGRGDDEYTNMLNDVRTWVKKLSGLDELVIAQGSSTFALELASHSFIDGKVLLISTGYYSDRLKKLLPKCELSICEYDKIDTISDKFDWVLCAYTETSIALKVDLQRIRNKCDALGARLFVDATGSIGLEENHHLADVMAFSSTKGLFGLAGACFIAYRSELSAKKQNLFYFDIDTHKNSMVTGAYHVIASLYGVIKHHNTFLQRVKNSKALVLDKWRDIVRDDNQPLLCTYLEGRVVAKDKEVVLYTPRSDLSGSVICHFGEICFEDLKIDKRISII